MRLLFAVIFNQAKARS